MGTRADFYIGRGPDAEWLGSIAWDGYPSGLDGKWKTSMTEKQYRALVSTLSERDDWTPAVSGWPWPWDDSNTTDFAYAFDGGKVYAACFGHKWVTFGRADSAEWGDAKTCVFPNMRARRNVAVPGSKESGVMVIRFGAKS